jgi:hypothetical protein
VTSVFHTWNRERGIPSSAEGGAESEESSNGTKMDAGSSEEQKSLDGERGA